ncbi:hypothetical protein HID58_033797 [Brassica napus]|uniref:Uncharacterized protein n=1 Tax=Brassica napus TaxID=3708 RepID=A0ABQ8C250_BRANA|nr:hypothetical protein HID58_033797 [Brassica napus]
MMKLGMWLSPATLELYHITWDDSASLLENIVAYEAVTSYQQPFGSQKKIRNRHLLHLAPSLNSCNGSSQTSHLTSRFGEDEGGGTQSNSTSFSENVLLPEEEQTLMSPSDDSSSGSNAMEALLNLLSQKNCYWATSPCIFPEEESGKALDSVANFHLQNVAKSIHLSGGIVVKYVYRLENIEYYA